MGNTISGSTPVISPPKPQTQATSATAPAAPVTQPGPAGLSQVAGASDFTSGGSVSAGQAATTPTPISPSGLGFDTSEPPPATIQGVFAQFQQVAARPVITGADADALIASLKGLAGKSQNDAEMRGLALAFASVRPSMSPDAAAKLKAYGQGGWPDGGVSSGTQQRFTEIFMAADAALADGKIDQNDVKNLLSWCGPINNLEGQFAGDFIKNNLDKLDPNQATAIKNQFGIPMSDPQGLETRLLAQRTISADDVNALIDQETKYQSQFGAGALNTSAGIFDNVFYGQALGKLDPGAQTAILNHLGITLDPLPPDTANSPANSAALASLMKGMAAGQPFTLAQANQLAQLTTRADGTISPSAAQLLRSISQLGVGTAEPAATAVLNGLFQTSPVTATRAFGLQPQVTDLTWPPGQPGADPTRITVTLQPGAQLQTAAVAAKTLGSVDAGTARGGEALISGKMILGWDASVQRAGWDQQGKPLYAVHFEAQVPSDLGWQTTANSRGYTSDPVTLDQLQAGGPFNLTHDPPPKPF